MTETVMLVRLNDNTDIVGEVTQFDDYITVNRPIVIMMVDINLGEKTRSIFTAKEYLPQLIVEAKSINFTDEDFKFIMPVKKEFLSYYFEVSNYLYTQPQTDDENQNENKDSSPEESSNNVVSFSQASQNKKDKNFH